MHIPFCRSKCRYCGFYSSPYEGGLSLAYCDVLAAQIGALNGEFRTIYIGGGTPTILSLEELKKIFLPLRKFSGKAIEFTIEANPESLTEEKLALFLNEGVNRISIGVQSFDNAKLKKLGRLHDRSCAVKAVAKAKKAGFKNIGIDLIFGIWDETVPGWKDDLKAAADLPLTHISCYDLTYEPGTSIRECVKDRSIMPLSEEISADMYDLAISYLAQRGFVQYEISNFSRPGFHCKHNYTYWNNDPYTGLGPSAVSYSDGIRRENVPDISDYIDKVRLGIQPVGSSEKLSPEESARETAAVKIRTMEGIGFDWFREKTGFDLPDLERGALPKLVADGFIERESIGLAAGRVRLTRKGILFCDTVSSAFL
ncbi:MAG: radical SAM family heme chaperone HemW [Candidatus Omnitrophica bacterium]|nr:radical SAM family heme chaperone HemW [Candidatus Omnitrophota bacterium]